MTSTRPLMALAESNIAESNEPLIHNEAGFPGFKEIIYVGDDKLQDAQNLASAIQKAAVNNETNKIELGNLLDFVRDNKNLALSNTINVSFDSKTSTAELINKIASAVLIILGLPVDEQNLIQYESAISQAFYNLRCQLYNNWFSITSSSLSETSYVYNILFLTEKENMLFALPLILTVELDTSKEGMLNQTPKNIFSYKIKLKGLKIMNYDFNR